MNERTPSEFNLDSLGVYDAFDTVVTVDFSRDEINDPNIAQHVAGHEQSHFFQNFFTLQGLSYYQIVRFIEGLTEDLLLAWRKPVPVPAFAWLQSLPNLQGEMTAAHYFDRYFRLFNQLETAHPSVNAVDKWSRTSGEIEIARCLQDKAFKVDVANRTFLVRDTPVFQIDYSAICESMAKAMEYFNRIATLARVDQGGTTPNQDAVNEVTNKVFEAAARDMGSPRLLNYTFSLLYLRQSGYDLHEAIHLTTVMGYVALMNNLSMASVPEIGVNGMVKFGTVASDVYAKLLQHAYDDTFLPTFNRLIGSPASYSNIIDYLDEIAAGGGANPVSKAHNVLRQYADTTTKSLRKRGFPRDLWFIRILECAKEYCRKLQRAPAVEGLGLLLSPSRFLYDSNVGPAIICSDGVAYQMTNVDRVSGEIATFSASLNFVKTLLFGLENLRVEFGETETSAQVAFDKYLQQFGAAIMDNTETP